MDDRALVSQLIGIRSSIDAILYALEEEQKEKECPHKNKLNLSTFDGGEEWICKDCNYHYKEERVELKKKKF